MDTTSRGYFLVNLENLEEDFDIDKIINQNLIKIDSDITMLNTLSTTTGTASAFLVALPKFTLVAGQKFTAKFHTAGTGNPTAAVNSTAAKPLKKGDGTSAFLPKSGGTYTFVYDGTNFVLQGEGASGNATASDLLLGKTSSSDAGDIEGTIPVKTGVVNTFAAAPAQWPDGALALYPEGGCYNWAAPTEIKVSLAQLQIAEPDLVAANWPVTKILFGLQGTIPRRAGLSQSYVFDATSTVGRIYVRPPDGCYDGGNDYVYIDDPDFDSSNWATNKNLFGRQGTIPVRTANNEATAIDGTSSGARLYFRPPNGLYNGATDFVYKDEPNFIASNFPEDRNVFGLQGTMKAHRTGGANSHTAAVRYSADNTRIYLTPELGLYDGGWTFTYADHPDFIQDNILAGKNPFGLPGTLPNLSNTSQAIANHASPMTLTVQTDDTRMCIITIPNSALNVTGKIDSSTVLHAQLWGLIPSNIRKGETIGRHPIYGPGGMLGTLVPAETAIVSNPTLSGLLNMSGLQYSLAASATYSTTGLTFAPTVVEVKCTMTGGTRANTDGQIGGNADITNGSFGYWTNWQGFVKLEVLFTPTANGGTVTFNASMQGPSDIQKNATLTIQSIKFIA